MMGLEDDPFLFGMFFFSVGMLNFHGGTGAGQQIFMVSWGLISWLYYLVSWGLIAGNLFFNIILPNKSGERSGKNSKFEETYP